jgi:hypothetical protein
MLWSFAISGVGVELPAHAADDDAGVDDRRPGTQPCSIATPQRGVGVVAVVAESRTIVKPDDIICMPFDTAWIARSAVESIT